MKQLELLIGLSASVMAVRGQGFLPLPEQHGIPLLADARWRGLAAALKEGFAKHLIMLGGIEKVHQDDVPLGIEEHLKEVGEVGFVGVPRGFATIYALEKDYGVPRECMSYEVTEGNTGGNVGAVNRVLEASRVPAEKAGMTTGLYHLPRSSMDFHAAGFQAILPVPAEAFWLATVSKDSPERVTMRQQLVEEFGDSPLTQRVVMELNGAADKLLSSYAALSS